MIQHLTVDHTVNDIDITLYNHSIVSMSRALFCIQYIGLSEIRFLEKSSEEQL